mgnify:FL=1|tara:strand:+ start:6079 stop:7116 length:1038 start_codon:yes stop_codon:yes gene_type:complete
MAAGYSEQTEGAILCIEAAKDWALDCVSSLPKIDHHVFIDYGAADGGTAVDFWSSILLKTKSCFPSSELTLIGNDLPSNDNQALINSLNYQYKVDKAINTFLSARSFYDQLSSSGSVSFGFSATAMHWLSRYLELKNHTHIQASGDDDNFKKFRDQALSDWEVILMQRSNELISGGKFLAVNLSRDSNNNYLGNNGGKTLNVHDQIHEIWCELLDEKIIDHQEYEAGTIQNFYKSSEEFIEPLINEDSPAFKSGLRLVKERTVYIECPYKKRWIHHKDDKLFSSKLMETIRSWSMHSFKSAIKRSNVSDIDPVNLLYQRLKERIYKAPDKWSLDYVEHHLVIEKV